MCAISQLCTSSERKLSCRQQDSHLPSKSLFSMSSLCQTRSSLCPSFLCFSDRSHMQEQAGSMPSTQAVAPSLSHSRDGSCVRRCECSTKNPSPQTLRSPKIRERLVHTPRSTARSCLSMSSYGQVLAASWRVLAVRWEPVYFLFSFKPLSISLLGHCDEKRSAWTCWRLRVKFSHGTTSLP